ncbi:MAG: AMP-binding protein [Actinobacteria bacterium]|nr:AMP-binding protein [Actinomycetota bacterium]
MSHFEIDQIRALLSGAGPHSIVVNTTGSTGIVKGIELTRANLLSSVAATHKFLGANTGDVWSLLLPTNHIAGINVVARSIVLESEVVGVDDYADFTAIVPTQLHKALNGDAQLLSHLKGCRAVLVGGAATSSQLLDSAKNAGIKVVTTYGSTETCGGCIYNNQPLEGVSVQIDQTGLLQVAGPMVFESGWYTTSDLAEIKDGKVFILGRVDDVIISGGENISLVSIEKLLGEDFIAFGVPDDLWGSKLCLASTSKIDVAQVSKLIVENIGKHAVPKEFVVISEIPLMGIGKPDRVTLLENYLNK